MTNTNDTQYYIDKWLDIITKCHPTDRVKAGEAMDRAYAAVGLAKPKHYWADDPKQGLEMAKELFSEVATESDIITSTGYGLFNAHWLATYEYYLDNGSENMSGFQGLIDYGREAGIYYSSKELGVVMTPKPSAIHLNNNLVLHNPDGPAISYHNSDFAVYSINGTRMDKWMVMSTPEELMGRMQEVLDIKNAEQRAETIKRIGVDRMLDYLPNNVLDGPNTYAAVATGEMHEYSLYEIDYSNGVYPPRVYLRMVNPSTDEVLIEPVHPRCRTTDEANAWRWGDLEFGESDESDESAPTRELKLTFPDILT